MAFEKAERFLKEKGYGDRISVFDVSSATVELAAEALGVTPGHIAKSMTFMAAGRPVMIIAAGDVKINNSKYKQFFGTKAVMLKYEEVSELIGHAVGGVCPFGINEGVQVYLDVSLKKYDTVYPACGDDASAVRLTPDELEQILAPAEWVDVCKEISV